MQFRLIALILTLGIALPALAEDNHASHMSMQPPVATSAAPSESASETALKNVMGKMHTSMNVPTTGDADIDFVRGMIPHHQGAIDMAHVVLQYGKDPETRALAEGIIKSQTKEIADMKAWLQKRKIPVAGTYKLEAPKKD